MTVLLWATGGCLGVAALLSIVRIVRGPTVLNRALAADVLLSVVICVIGVEAVVFRHTTTLPILISLSMVGFVASVSVARFVARDRDPVPEQGVAEVGPSGAAADPEGAAAPEESR